MEPNKLPIKYKWEGHVLSRCRAEIKAYPWYNAESKPRYGPTSGVLQASLSMIPLATSWTSPIFLSNNPPLSGFSLKYEVFAVITQVLCKLWSPNAPPKVPYPGVLPKGWTWENPRFWTQPGFEDGSLGRFDFSYIPQAISTRYLLHWAFVEASSSPTYPQILNRNPLDAWKGILGSDCRGSFETSYILDIISLWERTKEAVTRLELPPPGSFARETRHPSQTSEWHTLQRSPALLYFIGIHSWDEAIQVLGEWLRAIADVRAYLAYQMAIDCSTGSRTSARDVLYLGCWGNDLDADAITLLVDQDVPVYFVEDTTTCRTRLPRKLVVYHDPSALLNGYKFVPSPVRFTQGSSCRIAPGCDRTWTSAECPPPLTRPSPTGSDSYDKNATGSQSRGAADTNWGAADTNWGAADTNWGTADTSRGTTDTSRGTADTSWNMDGWDTQSGGYYTGPWTTVTSSSSQLLPEDSSEPRRLIDPPSMRAARALRRKEKARNKDPSRSRSHRLAGLAPVPPTYDDLTREPPSNTRGRWENWIECDCELKDGTHMFQQAKAPDDHGYTLFYDIPQKRRIYLERVQVRNPLSGVIVPMSRGGLNIFDFDFNEDNDDEEVTWCSYKTLGDDIPQGFTLQNLDFWGYGHKKKQASSTEVWFQNRKPLQVPIQLQVDHDGIVPGLGAMDDDILPPYHASGSTVSTTQETISDVTPLVIPRVVPIEDGMEIDTPVTREASQPDLGRCDPMVSPRPGCSSDVTDSQHEQLESQVPTQLETSENSSSPQLSAEARANQPENAPSVTSHVSERSYISQHELQLEAQFPTQVETSESALSPQLPAEAHTHQPENAPSAVSGSYVPEMSFIHMFLDRASDSGGSTENLIASLACLKDSLERMVNLRSAVLCIIEPDLDHLADIYVQTVDKTAADIFVQMAKITGVLQPGIGVELLASAVVPFSPDRVTPATNFPDVLQEISRRHRDSQAAFKSPVPLAQRLSDFVSPSADHPSGRPKSFKLGRNAPDDRPRECVNQHLSVEKQFSLLEHNRQQSISRIQRQLDKMDPSDTRKIKKLEKRLRREERDLKKRSTKLSSKQPVPSQAEGGSELILGNVDRSGI